MAILKSYRDFVWPKIESELSLPKYPKVFQIPPKYKHLSDFHLEMMHEYPDRKGKYLRPTILILVAESMGIKKEKCLNTAAAMQLSEEWILIHDDLEDESEERRGKPTLHKQYSPNLSINSGDALHLVMWNMLVQNRRSLGSDLTEKISIEFLRMLSRTILGQTVEMKWANENKLDMSDEDWYFIADGKTSYYTIAGPIRLGAIIAGATESQLEKLAYFGQSMGRCFQIVDDVLDVTTDFKGLKNQIGNDIYEGKRTIILGHLLRSSKGNDYKKLVRILSKPRQKKSASDITWTMKAMNDAGSIEYSKRKAKIFRDKAERILDKDLLFLSKQPYRNNLKTLMQFVLERDH